MSEKYCNNDDKNNSNNTLTSRRTDGGIKTYLAYYVHGPKKWTSSSGPMGEVGLWERFLRCLHRRGKPGLQHIVGCHAANSALGHQGWAEKPWIGMTRGMGDGCMRGPNNPFPAPGADDVHSRFSLGPPSLLPEEAPWKKGITGPFQVLHTWIIPIPCLTYMDYTYSMSYIHGLYLFHVLHTWITNSKCYIC